ncbi:MAG: PTS sugar transporter subunit IIB [Erysipelotrichaceae bacterium]|nr:PTS sugar transporter subunit IIB [Erysipelotrichaceae bacterium]
MITHLRIDNRLIHGQVAVTWKNHIGADKIIVTNDKVAADPIQKMALPLAARGSTVLVLSVAECIQYAKDHPNETMFVIAKFPSDALQILESGVEVKDVNVGNAAPINGTTYKMVDKSIAATAEDAVIYRKIAAMRGNKLISHLTPANEPRDFLKLLDEAGF